MSSHMIIKQFVVISIPSGISDCEKNNNFLSAFVLDCYEYLQSFCYWILGTYLSFCDT